MVTEVASVVDQFRVTESPGLILALAAAKEEMTGTLVAVTALIVTVRVLAGEVPPSPFAVRLYVVVRSTFTSASLAGLRLEPTPLSMSTTLAFLVHQLSLAVCPLETSVAVPLKKSTVGRDLRVSLALTGRVWSALTGPTSIFHGSALLASISSCAPDFGMT